MEFRDATLDDVEAMHVVRLAVRENVLSRPDAVRLEHYREMLAQRGRGWVCAVDRTIVGFVVVDLVEANVWALFVDPRHERRGIGRQLLDRAVSWSAARGVARLWLTTEPGTRAEGFYAAAGWVRAGAEPNGEIRFARLLGG